MAHSRQKGLVAAAVGMGLMSEYPQCVAGKPKIIRCCGEQHGAGEAGGPMGEGPMLTGEGMRLRVTAWGLGDL